MDNILPMATILIVVIVLTYRILKLFGLITRDDPEEQKDYEEFVSKNNLRSNFIILIIVVLIILLIIEFLLS